MVLFITGISLATSNFNRPVFQERAPLLISNYGTICYFIYAILDEHSEFPRLLKSICFAEHHGA